MIDLTKGQKKNTLTTDLFTLYKLTETKYRMRFPTHFTKEQAQKKIEQALNKRGIFSAKLEYIFFDNAFFDGTINATIK